ncbi:hypothetical protein [Dactylosporangium sp. NPDC005555]|uniref:hypothetical protein n=1 Tax=Dactylosporangium sp. NPDC005555 TaxID=3154889 RepID=UPI0033B9354B
MAEVVEVQPLDADRCEGLRPVVLEIRPAQRPALRPDEEQPVRTLLGVLVKWPATRAAPFAFGLLAARAPASAGAAAGSAYRARKCPTTRSAHIIEDDPVGSSSAFVEWQRALHVLTSDEAAAREWRRLRYRFAHRLGEALVGSADSEQEVKGPVLYGVWLHWGLLYIGQTLEAQRRLRDLPIGESHHLATTFPPEIWHRVVVIEWSKLPEATALIAEFSLDLIGLALEHGMQVRLRPLVNSERRTSAGGWRLVDWERSQSRGARAAVQIDMLLGAVQNLWDEAAKQRPGSIVSPVAYRVIFPERLVDRPAAP